jgi:hypothetical protein
MERGRGTHGGATRLAELLGEGMDVVNRRRDMQTSMNASMGVEKSSSPMFLKHPSSTRESG